VVVAVTAAKRGHGTQDSWERLRDEADGCRRCDLWKRATATVFGEGPVPAEVMLVGEQPGDQEDLRGRPFVGPAGRVLDEALGEVGVRREDVYVTNAVKHFKWEARGKRRLHKRPDRDEIEACDHWFGPELELVSPRLLVLLGATAAQSQLGPSFRVTRDRGHPLDSDLAEFVVATVHPSSVLRAGDRRHEAREAFTADLRRAVALLG
jgi:DNA polymerase